MIRRVIATSAHEIPTREPLRLAVGESVEAGERSDDWPAFVFVVAAHGSGWVPARHLSGPSGRVRVREPYDTAELPTAPSGWLWCRSREGRKGWVPQETVTPHQEPAEREEIAESAERVE
jgi:hypothetical protein